MKRNFIVIDHNKLDCFIAEKIIGGTENCEGVISFLEARKALAYITETPPNEIITVLLVTIQMPIMNGFEFIEAFQKLPEDIKKHYVAHMISSSINESDLNRVHLYPSIKNFITKPLTKQSLNVLLANG
jgi:YesN/AraC family two-component response regulator